MAARALDRFFQLLLGRAGAVATRRAEVCPRAEGSQPRGRWRVGPEEKRGSAWLDGRLTAMGGNPRKDALPAIGA